MAGPPIEITADDHLHRWVSPPDLLAELAPLIKGHQTAVNEVLARLEVGKLLAVAESASWRSAGENKDASPFRVPVSWWKLCPHIHRFDADFWRTGTLTVAVPRDRLGDAARVYTFLDVRFDPAGIETIPAIRTRRKAAPVSTPPDPSLPSARSVTVSNDEVKAWYRALPKPEKTLGLRALWAKAKGEVGPGVLRKQIEPFVAGRGTGPKGTRS